MKPVTAEDRAARLLHETPRILADPFLAHGGRILAIVDAARHGTEACLRELRHYGMIALPMTPRSTLPKLISALCAPGTEQLSWDTFRGAPDTVLPKCESVIARTTLPPGWQVLSNPAPSPDQISAIQTLNTETGVAPQPAAYIAGEIVPVINSMILDEKDTLVACAQASLRFHPESRLAGSTFNGLVSVAPDQRRRGLGTLVTAHLLRDSHTAWAWRDASANAKPDNAASRAMLLRCGLRHDLDHLMIVLSLGGHVTR